MISGSQKDILLFGQVAPREYEPNAYDRTINYLKEENSVLRSEIQTLKAHGQGPQNTTQFT